MFGAARGLDEKFPTVKAEFRLVQSYSTSSVRNLPPHVLTGSGDPSRARLYTSRAITRNQSAENATSRDTMLWGPDDSECASVYSNQRTSLRLGQLSDQLGSLPSRYARSLSAGKSRHRPIKGRTKRTEPQGSSGCTLDSRWRAWRVRTAADALRRASAMIRERPRPRPLTGRRREGPPLDRAGR